MASTVERLGRISNLVHGFIYFSTAAAERYANLGLAGRQQYFAGRAAPMGPVGPEMVVATFYNFNPLVVRAAIPSAWDVASPQQVQAARFQAVSDVLHQWCADVDPTAVARATEIAHAMVEGVGEEGKPIAAANRAVELPEKPLLRLWQLITIVREWRGDAHVAALGAAAVSGIEALVLHAATGQVPAGVLRSTRGWSDDDWNAAVTRLGDRGFVNADGSFTSAGEQYRADIESQTNTAAQALVDAVGDDAAARLYELLKPIRAGLLESGVFTQPLGGTS